jgi:hypothetical protein
MTINPFAIEHGGPLPPMAAELVIAWPFWWAFDGFQARKLWTLALRGMKVTPA